MTLLAISVALFIIGLFLSTYIYRKTWGSWPLDYGFPIMIFGLFMMLTLLVAGIFGDYFNQLLDWVGAQVAQIRP